MSIQPVGQGPPFPALTPAEAAASAASQAAAVQLEAVDAFQANLVPQTTVQSTSPLDALFVSTQGGDLTGQGPLLDPALLKLETQLQGATGDPLLDPTLGTTATASGGDPLLAGNGTLYTADSLLAPITTSLFDTLA